MSDQKIIGRNKTGVGAGIVRASFLFSGYWILTILVLNFWAGSAFAQGARSSLSGEVKDSGGAVMPGVSVIVKDQTGTSLSAVTNDKGLFSVPSITAGSYRVTLSLQGFKTVVLENVAVVAASPANVDVTMTVGEVHDTVEVSASSELVQTEATTVTTTVDTTAIQQLPMVTRNVMQSIPALLVGVDQSGGDRSATVNGLPQNSVKLTIDGINTANVQGEGAGSGFYSFVYPSADSIEAVTVSSATQGADSSGDGSASVQFVTKGGTDHFHGSFFEYFRNNYLNSNYFFNELNGLPKNVATVHNFGATIGGPILIPHLLHRGRAFFFVDLEDYLHPTSVTQNRTILSPAAQSGVFSYTTNAGVQQVNLLSLAAKNGQTSTVDPIVGPLLAQIRSGASTTGTITANTDPNTQAYVNQFTGTDKIPQPAMRFDVNLPRNNRFTSTYHRTGIDWAVSTANPPTFPGLPNTSRYISTRSTGSEALRSIISPHLVNVVTLGWQDQRTYNFPTVTADQFANQGGFNLAFPSIGGVTLTSATSSTGRQYRHAPLYSLDDAATWQHGAHTISFGGSATRYINDLYQDSPVAGVTFGVQSGVDPADTMFTAANFPGAASADLTSARNLYGFLTGRVTAVTANAALTADGKYTYLGRSTDNFHLSEGGGFIQDQWHVSSKLTLNAGLRYQVQLAPSPESNNYTKADVTALCGVSGTGAGGPGTSPACNLFKPGTLTGSVPQYSQFAPGSTMFNSDKNNFAPNVGLAWRPGVKHGIFRALLGDPGQATIRLGFSQSFDHEPLGTYLSVFDANPGRSFSATRNAANGNLVLAGQTYPLLFSDKSRLGAPATCTGALTAACYPATPTYPVSATTANGLSVINPNLQEPSNRQFSAGIQRSLSKTMALEVRYVATRSFGGISTYNENEITVKENGFLDEFKKAQANLTANIAAGKGQTFAYTGVAGTSPLPIFLASYNGVGAALAGDATKYTGSNWTNSTFTGFLSPLNPSPTSFASTNASNGLYGNSTFRSNGIAGGLPRNFWLMNPDVAAASYITNANETRYDGLQIDFRRRLTRGLLLSGNYSFSRTVTSQFTTIHQGLTTVPTTSGVPQSAKFAAAWNLPWGHGHALGGHSAGWLNFVAGNWNVSAVGHIQTGASLRLAGVRLVGMTQQDLQDVFRIRVDSTARKVYDLPQDIIDNTIAAYNTSAAGYTKGAPTGRYIAPASNGSCVEVYSGDCGEAQNVYLRGPMVGRLDLSFKKNISLGEKRRFELQFDLLNATGAINFNPVFQASASATINQVTSAYTNNNTDDPGGRVGQLVARIVW